MRFKVVSFNSEWEGFRSTRLKALAFRIRVVKQVKIVAAQNPDIIIVQEMGKVEAAIFFAQLEKKMGRNIAYQRFGPLNCVGWCKDVLPKWDSTLNVDTADYGQYPGRGGPIVKLVAKDGTQVRAASFHNPVKTSNDKANQIDSITAWCKKANDDEVDWPIILGLDSNSRLPDHTGMWKVFDDYGYDYVRRGIDALAVNFGGATLTYLKTVDLGNSSDHNLLTAYLDVPNKTGV